MNFHRDVSHAIGITTAVVLSAACTWAGDSTKELEIQPGAEGALAVDAADFKTLQAAVDAIPGGGGRVELPPGRFEIEEPVVITRGDVMICGTGTATHIVNQNKAGKPAVMIRPPQGSKSLWRVQVTDLRITGNPQSGPGILAKNVDELLVSRVAVEHNGGDGILMDHCYEDPRISDCLINYNAKTGLNLLGCHDIVVSANQFEENNDAVNCFDGYNLTMTGNNIDDHLGNGLVVRNTYGSVVSGNMIEECNGHAVVLKGDCYGDSVSANTFAHCQGNGLNLDGVRDITVTGNAFVLLADMAIHAFGGAAQLTITGNTFSRYPFDPRKSRRQDPGGGIVFEGVRDATVSGNTFTSVREEAVKVSGTGNSRILFTSNLIRNAWRTEPGEHAAIVFSNASSCVVAHNIITEERAGKAEKQPSYAVAFDGEGAHNVVEHNIVTGYERAVNIPDGAGHAAGNKSL